MWFQLTKQLSLENLPFPHTCAGTTRNIAVPYLGRPHLVRGQVSECKASIFELAKFNEHWMSQYQSHKCIASMTFLGIVQKNCLTPSAHLLPVEFFFLPHRPFNTSCTVPTTSNLSRILLIIALVGGGVSNSTFQLR